MQDALNKTLRLIILLFVTATSLAQKSGQLKLRRDVLLMVDSIEMAYSRACPEIPLKTINPKNRKADEQAIKKLNHLHYDSSSFAKYQSSMVQNGFNYETREDNNGVKQAVFSSAKGNLLITVNIQYSKDSIVNREVYFETRSNVFCYRKNGDFVQYKIDIFYIHSLAVLINFPFRVSLAEPTFTKADMEIE